MVELDLCPGASPWRRCARYSRKTNSSRGRRKGGAFQGERGVRGPDGRCAGTPRTTKSTTRSVRWCVLTRPPSSRLGDVRPPVKASPDGWSAMTPSTSETVPGSPCSVNRRAAGVHVEVTERRTAVDFAHRMKWLVDEAYRRRHGDPTGVGQSQQVSWARSTKRLHRPRPAKRLTRSRKPAEHGRDRS